MGNGHEADDAEGGQRRAEPESLFALLLALFPAIGYRLRGSIPLAVANRGITLCGMFLLVSPAVMWMAWSKVALIAMLVLVAAAFGLIMLLLWLGPGDHY